MSRHVRLAISKHARLAMCFRARLTSFRLLRVKLGMRRVLRHRSRLRWWCCRCRARSGLMHRPVGDCLIAGSHAPALRAGTFGRV